MGGCAAPQATLAAPLEDAAQILQAFPIREKARSYTTLRDHVAAYITYHTLLYP